MTNDELREKIKSLPSGYRLLTLHDGWMQEAGFITTDDLKGLVFGGWVGIATEDDLPPEHSQYLWQYRNLPHSMLAKWYPTIETEKSYWVENFIAWRRTEPLPAPYVPPAPEEKMSETIEQRAKDYAANFMAKWNGYHPDDIVFQVEQIWGNGYQAGAADEVRAERLRIVEKIEKAFISTIPRKAFATGKSVEQGYNNGLSTVLYILENEMDKLRGETDAG